ncbi:MULTISPECIES: hypothetical protein [Bacillus]|uniref:hypothetical protein n=1 Tax=Bacillus TaxID=1386 RepID=UPI0001CE399E|nr:MULTISPECIES: hypothetical protein [Bacillus]AMK73074.1 hypothetical protein AWV81_13500 [Bacillus subtilis subsp. natto]AOS68683.1 hypothetical protein A4A60_13875 [Bacillus subtilis]API42778.1 hypothetical protein BSR08_09785 [Bacillus subtilis]API98098.1 hypothetical protein BKP58_20835 [Bacillus subtilis]ARI85204.1 hypothetical protein B7470_03105 [Bacillus subtilis]
MSSQKKWGDLSLRGIGIEKPKIQPPALNHPLSDTSYLREFNEQRALEKERNEQASIKKEKDEQEYREQTLQLLAGIERNTAILHEISSLMKKNNDKQNETFDIIVEILEIMKSKSNEEVVGRYQKVMSKINQFTNDVETIKSLYTIGATIYSTASNMFT